MKLFIITLLATFLGLTALPATARSFAVAGPAKDTIRKKIIHPKEPMTDADATIILNAMRQKNTDQEKVVVLKDRLKDKGINMDQLLKLLNQFLTDDAKLESAQNAFASTTNYKSFLRIMDLFQQESYKYKLEDFYDKNRK
jgi:hypothetical protein